MQNWRSYTQDPWTLDTVRGYRLELTSIFRVENSLPGPEIFLCQPEINLCAVLLQYYSHLNKMGGSHSAILTEFVSQVWDWRKRDILIHGEHLPGVENIRAHWGNQHMKDASNWKLNWQVFLDLEEQLSPFSMDMFASRTNAQLPTYCSWRADLAALAVDDLSINISHICFPHSLSSHGTWTGSAGRKYQHL